MGGVLCSPTPSGAPSTLPSACKKGDFRTQDVGPSHPLANRSSWHQEPWEKERGCLEVSETLAAGMAAGGCETPAFERAAFAVVRC